MDDRALGNRRTRLRAHGRLAMGMMSAQLSSLERGRPELWHGRHLLRLRLLAAHRLQPCSHATRRHMMHAQHLRAGRCQGHNLPCGRASR